YSVLTRGSLSYSGQTYLYAVFSDHDVLDPTSLHSLPAPSQFIASNLEFVAGAALKNIRAYGHELFLDPKWLLLMLPAWPLIVVNLVRGRYARAAWPALGLATASFFLYALTWSTYRSRYQVLTFLLLIPFAVDALGRVGLSKLHVRLGAQASVLSLGVAVVAMIWAQTVLQTYRG